MSFPSRWPASTYTASRTETAAYGSMTRPLLDSVPAVPPLPEPQAFIVERVDGTEVAAHRDAWVDLMGRALEAQVFFDPDFVLPAALHLSKRRRPAFILVWSSDRKACCDLLGVFPVVDRADPLRALASAWLHDLSTLGYPLLDGTHAVAAWRSLLAWAGEGLRGARGLVIPSLPAEGPTARALRSAAGTEFAVEILDRWERAVLRPGQGDAGLSALSSKGAKELRRQRRRLSDRGTLAYVSYREGDALRDGVEHFLALEAAGWKGAAGTALLDHPGTTAFARTATRLLGARSLCRVDALTLDGEPIAMAMVLTAGATDFLWKIAYREDLARFSPGVQLVLALTEAQQEHGRLRTTDSCAIQRHPMIDRLWRDRLPLVDLVVGTRRGRSFGFVAAVAAERSARRLRAGAKRAILAWRTRRGGAGRAQAES